MEKNYKPSTLDYTNAITSSHNEEAKALNVIAVNSLVPVRFGKVELEYITSGNGEGEVGKADYYSNGVYQETRVVTRGDKLGTAHKTIINFIQKTPASLDGKCFVIYDDIGAVKVWFNVDFGSIEPTVLGTYRSIAVNILSSHDHETIANRTALALDTDSEFLAISKLYYVIASSVSVGVKQDSYDKDTGAYIKNTAGIEPITLNSTYWFINSAANANQYYVWYNVNGSGIDPLISGKSGIMVTISSGSTAEQVAIATKTALDGTGKFLTNISSDTLVIINKIIGVTDLAKENNTGFLILVEKAGENRELLVSLIMTYDVNCKILAVERI
jgi:hypothetical protein